MSEVPSIICIALPGKPEPVQPVTQQSVPASSTRPSEHDLLVTLFDLAHQVTSVLDQDELFQKISELLARVIPYDAFAVYLLDKKRDELRIAYPSGYPPGSPKPSRLKVGEGVVGTAIAEQRPMVVQRRAERPALQELRAGMDSALVVPLIYQTQVIGALNILSHQRDTFDESDIPLLRQFAAHVAVALENSRLFERERENSRGSKRSPRSASSSPRFSISTNCSRAPRSRSSG